MMQQGYLQYSNQPQAAYHHHQQQQQQHHHQSYQAQQQHQLYSMQQHQQQQQQHHHHQMNPNTNMEQQNQNNRFYKRQPNSDQPINRSIASNRSADSVPEAKKARYDSMQTNQSQSQQNQSQTSQQQQQAPTKVVSLRNIPADLTDLQIVLIGLQFGDVVNLLFIKAKGQALIDFSNMNEASEMIKYFRDHLNDQNTSSLKGIEAAHSSYQQLTIDNTNRAIQTMNTIQLAKQIKEASQNGGDACVIKALVTNIVYPICIDALYQVFSKYGNVLKIVLIQKNELGALIQMKDESQVQQAITNLNGRNMYNTYTGGCNILSLQVSRHKSIDVKSNNSKTWDYTNPLLPIQNESRLNSQGNPNDNQNKNNQMMNEHQQQHPLLPMPGMNMAAAGGHVPFSNTSPYMSQPQGHHHHQQMSHAQIMQGSNQASYNQAAAVAAQQASGYNTGGSAVVQISNFPDQIANPDAIFTLFGVYGDILKVKIMYNRRDNALMQYKTYEQALNAVTKMDKVKLFDKVISVGFSKFPEIQLPIKNDGGLAKDYSTSPLHRFKKPGSKNFYNIYPPNVTLHLSNISQMTSQEQVNELFTKYGTIKNFKWISKEGSKMALIELTSLEESVLALIALHNYQLNGSYLRVNFAKEYKYN